MKNIQSIQIITPYLVICPNIVEYDYNGETRCHMNLLHDRTEPTKQNVTTSTRDLCTLYRQVAITKQHLLYVYFKTIAHVYVQVQRAQLYRLNNITMFQKSRGTSQRDAAVS